MDGRLHGSSAHSRPQTFRLNPSLCVSESLWLFNHRDTETQRRLTSWEYLPFQINIPRA